MRIKHNTGPLELLVCDKCEYSTCNRQKLIEHSRTHTAERPFACSHCDYRANLNRTLQRHMKTKHNTGPLELLVCTQCEYSTCNSCHLAAHLKTHTSERAFACEICEYRATRNNMLQIHRRMKHNTGPKELLRCLKCEYVTCKQNHLSVHMKTHATNTPGNRSNLNRFACDYCDYTAVVNLNLQVHLQTKHNTGNMKLNKCSKCEYGSYLKGNLKKHMKTHTAQRSFACEYCDYKSAYKHTLQKHMLFKHKTEKNYSNVQIIDKSNY